MGDVVSTFKVHLFWEGHKILRNLHLTVDKSKVEIPQNFVAFSEYTNFNYKSSFLKLTQLYNSYE